MNEFWIIATTFVSGVLVSSLFWAEKVGSLEFDLNFEKKDSSDYKGRAMELTKLVDLYAANGYHVEELPTHKIVKRKVT